MLKEVVWGAVERGGKAYLKQIPNTWKVDTDKPDKTKCKP